MMLLSLLNNLKELIMKKLLIELDKALKFNLKILTELENGEYGEEEEIDIYSLQNDLDRSHNKLFKIYQKINEQMFGKL